MYSMNYIGKFIANFREFYNEINGATLTGAIDVVVVEQPDGSFTCSPFHVRFGKLGVLRSRFKVVDLELNGEPLNIHMKLGESGEAFFVEEVGDEDAEYAAHLATSPIPAGRFDLYEPRRRNSLSAVEPDHGQASDYTKRRYTADAQSMQKPDLSKLIKKDSISKEKQESHDDHDALFEMEGIDEVTPPWTEPILPKTFSATKLGEEESEATQAVQMISAHNDFRPIESASQDDKLNGNGKKKKKTRKSSSKKKHQRKSSTSSISSQSDRAGSELRPQCDSAPNTTDINFFSDSEVNTADILSEEMSHMQLSGETRIPLALSDTAFEVHAASRLSACVETTPVQSDTEVERGRGRGALESESESKSQSWRWGELPSPPPRPPGVLQGVWRFMSAEPPPQTEGVYLDDLDRGQVDPRLYLNTHHAHREEGPRPPPTEEEYESGNGPSLPQSPASPASPASLPPHGPDSDDDDKILAKGGVGVYVREEGGGGAGAVSRAVPFEEFAATGGQLLHEGRLVVRLGDRYLPWRTAGPLLLSMLAYRRPLPNRVLESLGKETGKDENATRAESKARGYSWWSWRRSNSETKRAESTPPKDANIEEAPQTQLSTSLPKTLEETIELSRTETPLNANEDAVVTGLKVDDIVESTPIGDLEQVVVDHGDDVQILDDNEDDKQTELIKNINSEIRNDVKELEQPENSSSDSDQDGQIPKRHTRRHSSFRKTLRLSSDQIRKLALRVGMNEMVFSVTTAYQGTTRCKCNVFRWRHDDKVVISDIDGTITKSDVLGHIFPLVGKDWAQSGVAQLFTKIKNNGYQLLYLSARAIGQAKVTREYLRSIKQGEVCLPDGPLLLNPTSLLRAFHREVIEKKPEEFKIQCLADIKALFPQGSNPFYAGYGNRVNDVCAYQAVGIPIVRIFTINYKGELKHELTQTFQSTYSHMSVLVDQVFPPALCEPTDQFSQTIYWREPLPAVDIVPVPAATTTH